MTARFCPHFIAVDWKCSVQFSSSVVFCSGSFWCQHDWVWIVNGFAFNLESINCRTEMLWWHICFTLKLTRLCWLPLDDDQRLFNSEKWLKVSFSILIAIYVEMLRSRIQHFYHHSADNSVHPKRPPARTTCETTRWQFRTHISSKIEMFVFHPKRNAGSSSESVTSSSNTIKITILPAFTIPR